MKRASRLYSAECGILYLRDDGYHRLDAGIISANHGVTDVILLPSYIKHHVLHHHAITGGSNPGFWVGPMSFLSMH